MMNFLKKKRSSDSDKEETITDICEFFSPELGKFESVDFSGPIEKFKECRIKGQNASYICELIRQDSVEEFITYVNKNNISLSSVINESIFETNSFLINKNPQLIEYAAFFGSIQIFQYIKINCPKLLNGDLWLYGIHSNNAEMIHILEENQIFPKDRSYEECMIESIKCHHNEIVNYIRDMLYDKSKSNEDKFDEDKFDEDNYSNKKYDPLRLNKSPLLYHNYEFIPDDFESIFKLIFYLMQNEYSSLVKFLNDQTQFFFDINNYEYVDKRKYANSIYFYEYILKDKRTLEKFVLKIFKKENYVDDLSRMMICKCPSILDIKGFSLYNDKEPSILTDFFYITLHKYIDEKRKGLSSSTTTNDYIIILGITIGLRYLHKNGIIHEILCPDSILLDENLHPIIQNVELIKKYDPIGFGVHDFNGYESPEQIEGFILQASNVFSYSFIIYYLMTLHDPLKQISRRFSIFVAFHKILNGSRPHLGQFENENISDFFTMCWHTNPERRLTFDEIFDFITKEEFYEYFEPFDHYQVKAYLDEYGNEFDEIKKRFE